MDIDVDDAQVLAGSDGTIACDPDGGIRLLVGDKEVSILVSSAVMKLASKVFKVMLGPNFKEGKELRENLAVSNILLDDDPQAMAIACLYLHHKFKRAEILWDSTRLQLEVVLGLLDKYDAYSAVQASLAGRFSSTYEHLAAQFKKPLNSWTFSANDTMDTPGWGIDFDYGTNSDNDTKEDTVQEAVIQADVLARTIGLLTLFYRVEDGMLFAKFSSLLVLHHVGSLFKVKLQYDPHDGLPMAFYAALEKLRDSARQHLIQCSQRVVSFPNWWDTFETFQDAGLPNLGFEKLFGHICDSNRWAEGLEPHCKQLLRPHLQTYAVMTELSRKDVYPPPVLRLFISEILENWVRFDEDHALRLFGMDVRRQFVQCELCPEASITTLIQQMIKEIKDGIHGVCLECIKKGRYMGEREDCCLPVEQKIRNLN